MKISPNDCGGDTSRPPPKGAKNAPNAKKIGVLVHADHGKGIHNTPERTCASVPAR